MTIPPIGGDHFPGVHHSGYDCYSIAMVCWWFTIIEIDGLPMFTELKTGDCQ